MPSLSIVGTHYPGLKQGNVYNCGITALFGVFLETNYSIRIPRALGGLLAVFLPGCVCLPVIDGPWIRWASGSSHYLPATRRK